MIAQQAPPPLSDDFGALLWSGQYATMHTTEWDYTTREQIHLELDAMRRAGQVHLAAALQAKLGVRSPQPFTCEGAAFAVGSVAVSEGAYRHLGLTMDDV